MKNVKILVAILIAGLLGVSYARAYGPTDLTHLHPGLSAQPPIGWIQFCNENPVECIAPRLAGGPAVLTTARWRELDAVNRFFNQSIRPVTDREQYSMVEKWTYAVTSMGDCEDYVLEKRRRLLQLGWPSASVLITVVIDKQNSGHAVLTVVTDRGEFVLDNVADEILPWSTSSLTFVKRQSPSDPNVWVDLGRVLGTLEVITATTRR